MPRNCGLFFKILCITVGAMIVSLGVAEAIAASVQYPTGMQHFVVALVVPALVTPIWAYPLLRANRRLSRASAELAVLAHTDPLCGVLNRRAFFQRAAALCRTADRNGNPIAVMMIDLDRFKTINDVHGHDVGDSVIRAVAATIDRVVRERCPDAIFARLGGDEFAIAVNCRLHVEVGALAEEMCAGVRHLVEFEGREISPTTISIGVAVRRRRQSIDEVLKTADEAVYQAKARGRDRSNVVVFPTLSGLGEHVRPGNDDRPSHSRVA
jgi:diguanylate cyclase (GGDEF)-like protein